MAPLRAVLRSIPEEWVEKDWLSMAAVPMQLSLGLFGRLFMYRIVEPSAMILVNFALLFLELAFRLTVSHRDKFYSRILGCMPQSVIKSWFGQKHNVKFRCDNLIGEMALEYYCMFAMFVQQFALVRRTNPEEASNAGHGERSRSQLLTTQKQLLTTQVSARSGSGTPRLYQFGCSSVLKIAFLISVCLRYFVVFCSGQKPALRVFLGIIFANLVLQFVLELACDTICMYVEVNKQKAPLVKAWEGRKRTWPFVFAMMTGVAGPVIMIGLTMGTCAMKHPDTGDVMWMICPAKV